MNPLVLSDADYRAVFDQVAQLSLDYLARVDELPSFPRVSGEQTVTTFAQPLPEEGLGPAALDQLNQVIEIVRPCGPRFFGYVLGSGEPIAAAADFVASVLNQNLTAWRSSPSGMTIERTVVGWLAEAIGCKGFSGSLTGGGSPANLMGLAMAREARLSANEGGVNRRGAIYASEQVHMSIPKAVALLGIGRENLHVIGCDEQFRIRTDLLQKAIEKDIRVGIVPIAVIGTAGTVATGSIDPLAELAAIAHERGAWFHVDGAYGALAAIAEPEKFAGLNQADSISLDPHKWLYQPLDCGCLLYKDAAVARQTFSHSGDYARVLNEDPVEGFANFEESMELSRRFRGLKLWLSLRYHGLRNFRGAIHNDLQCARDFASWVSAEHELELLAPVPLSAVCFRYVPISGSPSQSLDQLNQHILSSVIRRGKVFLSNATIHGIFALRACVVNHRATPADLRLALDEVLAVGRKLSLAEVPS